MKERSKRRKEITLDLHKEGDALVLNSQDIYNFIGSLTDEEIRLAYYIDKWCQYLNYFLVGNNKEMAFGDVIYARLESWIDGYNFAAKYQVDWHRDRVEIKTKKHLIVLKKPFEI